MPHHRILYEFRVRDDSARAKFLTYLFTNSGKQIPYTVVMDAVYGKKKGSKQSFAKLICQVKGAIRDRKLAWGLVQQRDQRGQTIGLYPIERDDFKIGAARATLAALNPKGWLAD